DPQVAGVGLEGRTEAGAEAVGIDQQVGELAQFQVSAAVGKILQRFGARGVGLQFQVELSELCRQIRVCNAQPAAGVEDRGVQALTSLDAQHQQVQGSR